MSTTQPVIRTEGLTKTFGPVRALDGLDLEVAPGEVHGFLGPNGSGKSTTIRVVLSLIRASGGHVELFGGEGGDEGDLLPVALGVVADPLGRVEVEPLDQGGPAGLVEPALSRAEDVEALAAGEPRPECNVAGDIGAVSYTHLTLPTNREV